MGWWRGLRERIKKRQPLRKYTSFKIGGPAELFIEPKNFTDLQLLLAQAKKYKKRVFVLGAGSNILIHDRGVKAIVLRLNSGVFKKISFCGNYLELGAGVLLSRAIFLATRKGLGGLEFLSGIPGTVGGALAMNAGIPDKHIASLMEKVTVMDYNGKIRLLKRKEVNFTYRFSDLAKYIILSCCLKLKKSNQAQIQKRIREYLDYRRATQDLTYPSCGCIFKNPPGDSAGRLIDLSGLKGRRIGDACISEKHANFILNLGQASARDVLKLMVLIKREVKKKFKVTLEPEIKIWQ